MPVDPELWHHIAEHCLWSTAFASPLWHAVTEEIEPQDASFEWERILTPLRKIRLAKGLLRAFESTVPGVPAGPISLKVPDEEKINSYWQELKERTKGRFLIHLREDSPFCKTHYKKIATPTRVLKIKEREKKLSKHHLRNIRKAEKIGIRVTPARREDDLHAFYQMYEESLNRWKKKPARIYSEGFFEKIKEILLPADAAGMFIAWLEEKPQAGALVLWGKERGVYWHGVSASDSAPGAGHLLHWEIMKHVEERGLETYDFGPSPGLGGVQRFKKGFGAQKEKQVTVIGPAPVFASYYARRQRR